MIDHAKLKRHGKKNEDWTCKR